MGVRIIKKLNSASPSVIILRVGARCLVYYQGVDAMFGRCSKTVYPALLDDSTVLECDKLMTVFWAWSRLTTRGLDRLPRRNETHLV